MEEKQLNFNAPLLSVRRFTSTAASNSEDNERVERFLPKKPFLPFYKAELKSGPVRNPGAVPFLWEQIPGRPKDGSGLHPNTTEFHPLVPILPPGKTVGANQPSFAKSTEEKEPEALTLTKTPPRTDNFRSRPDVFSSNGNVTSPDRSKGDFKEEHQSDSVDHDDDAFSDALDSLSHAESVSMNCSLSGISAIDFPELNSPRSSSVDPQAWEFMMDRFLPAAKAMASGSGTPQYASRKHPVIRQVNHGDEDRRPLPFGDDKQPYHPQYKHYALPQHCEDEKEEDGDDNDDDYDESDNLTAKACGILPRFCLKNSLCLLNPVPGLKIQTRMPLSSVHRKVTTHVKNTDPESLSEPDPASWEAVYKHKLLHGIQPPVTNDDESKPTSESNQLICWSDSQTLDGSSSCRHSTGDGITPHRNEVPQSPFHEGIGFLGVPKESKDCKADGLTMYGEGHNGNLGMLSCESYKHESGLSSPAIEKTLYIDSVHMLDTSNLRPRSSDIKELMSSTEKDSKLLVGNERSHRSLTFVDGIEGSILGVSMDNGESLKLSEGLVQEAKSFEGSKVLISRGSGVDSPEHLEKDQGNSYAISLQSPLPPPLPKSPSESWLGRTLPSVSSMNPSSRSYLGVQFRSKKQLLKEMPVDFKWETIVKTSNAQHSHSRFSEEMKITASHPSET